MKFKFKTTYTEIIEYEVEAGSYDEAMDKANTGEYDEGNRRVIDAEDGEIFDIRQVKE